MFRLAPIMLALVVTAAASGCDNASPSSADASLCCAIEEPTCNCFAIGGSRGTGPNATCDHVCDAPPDSWKQGIDENGCPILVWNGGGTGTCLPFPVDAGLDGGGDDAGLGDGGLLDAQ